MNRTHPDFGLQGEARSRRPPVRPRPQPRRPSPKPPGRGGGAVAIAYAAPPPPPGLSAFSDFPESVLKALRSGLESTAIRLAAAFGLRDENRLSSLVFYTRHPERGGRPLQKGEPGFQELSREWLDIRDRLVRPILAGKPATPPAPSGSFRPVAVESPGGGRIQDKRDPSPADVVKAPRAFGGTVPLHRLAAQALEAMIREARAAGFAAPLLMPVSGYRSKEHQARLWEKALKKAGGDAKEARKWVAPPGGSAHQSGRAVDLWLGHGISSKNVAAMRGSAVWQWLERNAARFGFYPYGAEPWHWEYNPPARSGESEISEEISSPNLVIDPRIDVHAQYALLRMSKNPGTAGVAADMLAAVKSGQIGGIYKEDQYVPAQLAKRNGLGWWQLVQAGEDAVLVFDGSNPAAPPLIVFRSVARFSPSRLDPALIKAFRRQAVLMPFLIQVAQQLGLTLSPAEGLALASGKRVSLASRPAEFHRARAQAVALSARNSSVQGEIPGRTNDPRCGNCPNDCQCDCRFLFRVPFVGPVCFCFGGQPPLVIFFCWVF